MKYRHKPSIYWERIIAKNIGGNLFNKIIIELINKHSLEKGTK